MSGALFAIVVVAALACPLHMLWHARRHRGAAPGCRAPADNRDVAGLRARRQAVADELARRQAPEQPAAPPAAPPAVPR